MSPPASRRSRRRRRGALRLLAATVFLAGCAQSPEPWRQELVVFGTRATIEIRGASPEQADRAGAELSELFAQFHRDWHAWEPSALTRLNAAIAAGEAAPAPDSLLELIRHGQALSVRSDGLVDPGIGGLVALWGFHASDYPLTSPAPADTTVAAWQRARPSVNDLRIDGTRVSSRNPAVQLDFGAIAEGAAAAAALQRLRAHGVAHALLNLGGDVTALGDADGRPWLIGVRDPFGDVLASVHLQGGESLFASGGYNKFRLDAAGQRWPHILDPRSGRPARGTATAVVVHSNPILADAAATALVVGGVERFADLLDRFGLRCALLLTEDDRLWTTTAMQARLTLLRTPDEFASALDRGEGCGPS